MKPFFSVIIPTLNEEKYLPKLLKSLSLQTFRNFELIVVDAKSQDGTVTMGNKFKHLMPKMCIVESGKKNVAYQRNIGAMKSTGEYLIFLDADVGVGETFLEEIHLAAIKKKFPLATTWMEPDSNKSYDNVMTLLGNVCIELAKVINQPFGGGYNTIVRRDKFMYLGGFREDLKIAEDHDFVIRAERKKIELTILKEPRVICSLRRFRSEGTLNVMRKYAQTNLHMLLKGPITHELFDYPMGGHVHKRRKRRKLDLTKIDTYIQSIEKIEKKLDKLLSY